MTQPSNENQHWSDSTTEELFPEGQPTHIDFMRMVDIVNEHDRMSDSNQTFAETIKVDMASLGYMAHQRAMRAEELLTQEDDGTLIQERDRLVMMWFDAFTAGQQFGARFGLGDALPPVDGNRRQRRSKK
jgi:hypothetical protein